MAGGRALNHDEMHIFHALKKQTFVVRRMERNKKHQKCDLTLQKLIIHSTNLASALAPVKKVLKARCDKQQNMWAIICLFNY